METKAAAVFGEVKVDIVELRWARVGHDDVLVTVVRTMSDDERRISISTRLGVWELKPVVLCQIIGLCPPHNFGNVSPKIPGQQSDHDVRTSE